MAPIRGLILSAEGVLDTIQAFQWNSWLSKQCMFASALHQRRFDYCPKEETTQERN